MEQRHSNTNHKLEPDQQQQQQQQQQQPSQQQQHTTFPRYSPSQRHSVVTNHNQPPVLRSQHLDLPSPVIPSLPSSIPAPPPPLLRSYDMRSMGIFANPTTPAYSSSTLQPGPILGSSPPTKRPRSESSYTSPQPNMSYTRGSRNDHQSQQQQQQQQQSSEQENEDQRFLRLARDALVATAQGVSGQNNQLVDPTISDLLTRLQYASSPHGNPISQSEKIRADNEGKLMIQGFYSQFPNLSNDIFTGSPNRPKEDNYGHQPQSIHNPSGDEEGWNFLIGDSTRTSTLMEQTSSGSRSQSISISRKSSTTGDSDNPARKFLCDKCSMSFRRSSDLKRHEKQHLSIPPNICELCGKGFARKDALKRHMGTLTCKRNSEKKLYIDNLNYLGKRGDQIEQEEEEEDDDDEEEVDNEEDRREGSSNQFSRYDPHNPRSDWAI